jgi:hypothetical protein
MNIDVLINNLLSAPVLFFFLGLIAVLAKSDLEIPQPVSRFFSIYLLFTIGIKGGVELAHNQWNSEVLLSLLLSLFMSAIVPIYAYYFLRKKYNSYNSAAIAATYGSISVVTFISAIAFLKDINLDYGGHMVAAMTLMESPALIVSLFILKNTVKNNSSNTKVSWIKLLHESLVNSSVFLILGSLLVGIVASKKSYDELTPFTEGLFKGFLSLFLLDMGIVAAKRINSLAKGGAFLISFAIILPLVNSSLAILLAYILGISQGNAFLLAVLSASASYIAVPAAVRLTIPEANPGLFVPMALAITFPFNITLGIPLYYFITQSLWA